MKKLLVCTVAIFCVLAQQQAAATQTSARAARDAAQTVVSEGFSGAVLVARRGRILLNEAYGEIRDQRMRRGSRFWISSIGKQFISAGIMRCVDLGHLQLDSTLIEVWPDTPSDKQAITVRQLLSHTSGIPQAYDFEAAADGAQARDSVFVLPLEAAPGERFIYSNANYALAAGIIERICGEDHATFIGREIIGHAGLHNTGSYPHAPSPHVVGLIGETPPAHRALRWWQAYYSTTLDLYRWRQALWNGRILSQSSRDALLGPVIPITEGHAALGWFVGRTARGSERTFVRGNDDTGQNSLLYYYPETDTTIIVLTHAGDRDDDTSWSRAMLDALEAALEL